MKSVDVIGAVFFDELDQILSEAGENGSNCYNCGYTDHNSEHRQCASEFMCPDAVKGHRDNLRMSDGADIHLVFNSSSVRRWDQAGQREMPDRCLRSCQYLRRPRGPSRCTES